MPRDIAIALLLSALVAGGCSTGRSAASATGRLAGRAVVGTAKFAGRTSVMVAGKTARTGVNVGTAAVRKTARMVAPSPIVTFIDAATGVARAVPWEQGLKLYAASKSAEVSLYAKSFELVRGTEVFRLDWRSLASGAGDFLLQPGDVIRLASGK